MGLSGLISLIVVAGIAGGAYYYRDGIDKALHPKSQEEKDYDFERKQKENREWDKSGWNPDNWFNDSKTDPKQENKGYFDPNNDPSKFNPPNTEYNKNNPYGYIDNRISKGDSVFV